MTGIDIGSKTIKVIDLDRQGKDWILKASGVVGYSGVTPDKMTDDKEFKSLADIITKLVKQVGINNKNVIISIPEPLVFTRVIKFPKLSEEEVAAAVKWEAEQYIPIPASEAVIQHNIISMDEQSPHVTVLLVAAPKIVVEKFVKVFRLAGLTPLGAENELLALSRSISPETGISLLIDVGVTSTDIAIVDNKKLSFSRSIPIAGEALTRAVAQGLGVNAVQAEEYKKTYGMSASQLEGRVRASLEPVVKMIVDEIKKSIHFYQSESKTNPPASAIITGGTTTMPDLVPYLTEVLGMETAVGNPFSKVRLDAATAESLAPYSSLYGVAVGLAMREG